MPWGGINLRTHEFTSSNLEKTKNFIIDKRRSWGNSLDWDRLGEVVDQVARGGQITTLGNSTGGFLAILAAGMLNAAQAVAFAPQ